MTYHHTASGHIEMLDKWGHGRAPSGDWHNRPATLIDDDGDGHYSAWAYSGDKLDAARKLAEFFRPGDETKLAVLDGNRVSTIYRDEWAPGVEIIDRDDDGEPIEWRYFPERHPGGLMMI